MKEYKSIIPTYDKSEWIIIKMIEPIEIQFWNNPLIFIQLDQSKIYKVPYQFGLGLCKQGYCYYSIKPEDFEQ